MSRLLYIAVLSLFLFPNLSTAEPVIVFPRSSSSLVMDGNSNNQFIMDENYSANYLVKKGDVLGSIIRNNYSGTSLDRNVLQFGIVRANRHAFRGGNANFLLAGKSIKLPSINNFRDMIFRKSNQSDNWDQETGSKNIYFFGQ